MFTQAYLDGRVAAFAKFAVLNEKMLFNEPPPLPVTGAQAVSHPLDPTSFRGRAGTPNIEHMIQSSMAQHPAPASMGNVPLRAKSFKRACLEDRIKQAFDIGSMLQNPMVRGIGGDVLKGAIPAAAIGALTGDEGHRMENAAKWGLGGALAGGVGGAGLRAGARRHEAMQGALRGEPDLMAMGMNPVSTLGSMAVAHQRPEYRSAVKDIVQNTPLYQ